MASRSKPFNTHVLQTSRTSQDLPLISPDPSPSLPRTSCLQDSPERQWPAGLGDPVPQPLVAVHPDAGVDEVAVDGRRDALPQSDGALLAHHAQSRPQEAAVYRHTLREARRDTGGRGRPGELLSERYISVTLSASNNTLILKTWPSLASNNLILTRFKTPRSFLENLCTSSKKILFLTVVYQSRLPDTAYEVFSQMGLPLPTGLALHCSPGWYQGR